MFTSGAGLGRWVPGRRVRRAHRATRRAAVAAGSRALPLGVALRFGVRGEAGAMGMGATGWL